MLSQLQRQDDQRVTESLLDQHRTHRCNKEEIRKIKVHEERWMGRRRAILK